MFSAVACAATDEGWRLDRTAKWLRAFSMCAGCGNPETSLRAFMGEAVIWFSVVSALLICFVSVRRMFDYPSSPTYTAGVMRRKECAMASREGERR